MREYDEYADVFASVDPLTEKYPELTPFQFASNSPIVGIDRDGLEFFKKDDTKNHIEYKPVATAGTIGEKISNSTYNALALATNGTVVQLFNLGQAVNNYLAEGYKKPIDGPEIVGNLSQNIYNVFHTPVTFKDVANAATNLNNYEIIPQLLIFHTLETPVETPKIPDVEPPVNDASGAIVKSRVESLPEALRARPKWRQSTIDYLNKYSPKDAQGNFLDAKTQKPILGQKHIGHLYESWREYQDNPVNWDKTRGQVIDDYNDVTNLGYEDVSTNSSNGAKTKGLENKH